MHEASIKITKKILTQSLSVHSKYTKSLCHRLYPRRVRRLFVFRVTESAAISVIDEVLPKNVLIGDRALLGLIINRQSQLDRDFISDLGG